MQIDTPALGAAGLRRFQELRPEAIDSVTQRFYDTHGSMYAEFGQKGRDACREDLGFHLEFLRPVLEFGLAQPLVDYLRWLENVLASRDIPARHLPLSLEWLAEFFATRMQGPDGGVVAAALRFARARLLEAGGAASAIDEMMPAPWPESEAFEGALLAGDRHQAKSLLDECLAQGRGLVDSELHMIQPALYSIGRKWQRNQVTVVQEHLATVIAQHTMSHALQQTEAPAANGRRVVLACVEGNHHAVGLQMVSDSFHLAGWDVQYLGANVPTHALVKHVDECKPDLLGLSISFAQQFSQVREIIARLGGAPGAARPAVIVGGLAINQFNPLARQLGADAWSPDARAAVTSASKLALEPRAG